MATVEQQPPIISRLNRLDNVVRHLEEMSRGSQRSSWESSSGSPSTCSDGRSSSSPRSGLPVHESFKHCRPIDDVVSETRQKGTLLHRLSHLEERVLEVCLHMEKEMMEQRRNSIDGGNVHEEDHHQQPSTPTKKFKQFVKSCVKSKSKSKSKSKMKS